MYGLRGRREQTGHQYVSSMLLWRRNLIYIYYDLTTITDSSRQAYFAKNIDDLLVVVGPTIKSVHFIFHSIIVVFYVQHLISTY
jgi:hypothetical protein